MPDQFHPPWLEHSNYTWRRVQVLKLLIIQVPPTSHHLISLRSKYSQTPSVYVPLLMSETKFHTHKLCIAAEITFLRNSLNFDVLKKLPHKKLHIFVNSKLCAECFIKKIHKCSLRLRVEQQLQLAVTSNINYYFES
jgi:hypothetical protein